MISKVASVFVGERKRTREEEEEERNGKTDVGFSVKRSIKLRFKRCKSGAAFFSIQHRCIGQHGRWCHLFKRTVRERMK